MRNIWTIAKKEYKAFYSTLTAYIFTAALLLFVGVLFYNNIAYSLNYFGQVPPPDVQVVIWPTMFLLIFATPAFTMRLLSEEQRLGTIEILLTVPIRDWEVVVGKWLGSFLFVLTNIAITIVYPLALHWMIKPGIDQGLLISGYLGVILVAGVFLSIGVAASSFFSNQVASFLVALLLNLVLWWIIGIFSQVSGGQSTLLRYLDLGSQFNETFFQGVIDLSAVVYFLSLIAGFLTLGAVSVETRRWR